MDLAYLLESLSESSAFPYPVQNVEVRQTHISVVFLAGRYAYKVKKPVNLGFLDFTTLAKRRHFCEEEIRLNRRLAPWVYLGVVPVALTGSGVTVEGNGEALEWAVKMERLPEDATLQQRLGHGEVGTQLIENLARKVASFHAAAERGEHIASFGRFDVVARNARENFRQAASYVGTTVSPFVFDRLQILTEQTLMRFRSLFEKRAQDGVTRDTHGDLRLDHVYFFPERTPPADLAIIDCIEFNERFRFCDPVSDMAFLVMDLMFHGRRDLARVFTASYFDAANDDEGPALLPFYTAYRAVVRSKVEGFELAEKEIPEAERAAALTSARAHWLLALGELEIPKFRPCLALVGGMPGSGKSTLARALAEQASFHVIRSDIVRKELTSKTMKPEASWAFAEGLYAPGWTEQTYAECLRRAEALLFDGKRVLVDATFRQEGHRKIFLEAATRWGVPAVFFLCETDQETCRRRLRVREGDASDADWSIYLRAAELWEEPGNRTCQKTSRLSTGGSLESSFSQALALLRELRLED